MPSKNEIQSSSLENQLLNELQSTVKSRWNEFDNALPTGASFKSEYQSMKNAYDGLIADLSSVKTDEELKKNQVIKGKIDDFLNQLGNYLKREDRRKDLDGTLTETNTQIAELRNKIYVQQLAQAVQAESGKLQQEVATNKQASNSEAKQEFIPGATTTATVAAVGVPGLVASLEQGSTSVEDSVKEALKPFEKMKKWKSDVGSALDAGWELMKNGDIRKGIELFFAVLVGGNLKDALAKYTGKKDESVTSTTPEKPSQSGANEAQEKEKQKENLKINEATKLLVAINSEEGTPDAQKSQMAKFLSDRSFRSLPLSAIGPEFVRNGYKIKDNLQKTLKPSIEQSGVSLQDAEKALKCMFSQEGLVSKQLQIVYQRAQEKYSSNATVAQGILESYSSLGIFMKLANREPGVEEIDIGVHYDPQTGQITGGAKEIIGDRLSGKSIYYLGHLRSPDLVPKSSKDLKLDGEDLKEDDKKEIAGIVDFTNKIRGNYQTIFGKQMQNPEIASTIKSSIDTISYSNALKVYALLDGNSDPTRILDAQRFALFMFLGNSSGDTQKTSQFNTYMIEQAGWQALGKTNDLPPSFSQYAELFLKKTWNVTKGVADKTFDGWIGVARENKILATAMFMAFVFSLRWTKTTGIESLIPSIKK